MTATLTDQLRALADVVDELEAADVDATLADVLDVVEAADTATEVRRKIGGDARTVQDLLWELGLWKPGGGLHDGLEERIAGIREYCFDESERAIVDRGETA